jgi:hypothetical protein
VHVLSLYLGGEPSSGSFHAACRGVAVVCSAGNSGPALATTSNLAPWILTSGASTMDREFPSYSYVVFDHTKAAGSRLARPPHGSITKIKARTRASRSPESFLASEYIFLLIVHGSIARAGAEPVDDDAAGEDLVPVDRFGEGCSCQCNR